MSQSVKVFVSYSWSAERETKIVDELERLCKLRGINLIRDNNALSHDESIKNIMKNIGTAEHVITVFSKPYFQSESCMNELLQIYRHEAKPWPLNHLYELLGINQFGHFAKRTHTIIVDDCNLADRNYRLSSVKYWENKYKELEADFKGKGSIADERKDLKLYKTISKNINKLHNFSADRISTPLAELRKQAFTQILDRIRPGKNRQTPDMKAAWINREPQWKHHILDTIKANAQTKKTLAFIISGAKEEWPDAFELRFKSEFNIAADTQIEIQPEFASRCYKGRNDWALWDSILQNINPTKSNGFNEDVIEAMLVDELSHRSATSKVFTLKIKQQTEYELIKTLVVAWQTLKLKDQSPPHYLIILYEFQFRIWQRKQKNIDQWHEEMQQRLESNSHDVVVPKLDSPKKSDLDTWISEHNSDLFPDDQKKLLKTLKKEMGWRGKAPHLKLYNTYLKANNHG